MRVKTKIKVKKGRIVSIGKPLSRGFTDFNKRFSVHREVKGGLVVKKKRTGELLYVHGDRYGRTVIETVSQ